MEHLKFVPRTDEPLPSFEEILKQKPKPIDVKMPEDKRRKELNVLGCEHDAPEEAGIGDIGDESPETEVESPNDFSSTSSKGSKITTDNTTKLSKVAKSKEERDEVLAAITGRPATLTSKPFRIPKTVPSEVESVLKWKSPLQDIGHIEMFRFGPKQELNKSSIVGSERLNIYDAIISNVDNQQEIESQKSLVPLPLGESNMEEPSTSSGVKKLETEVQAVSWRDEELMTPDSTTPDRYLEIEETSQTATTLMKKVDANRPAQPLVTSSSTEEIGN